MRNINYHIKELREKGITKIKNILSDKECDYFVDRSNKLFLRLLKKNRTHTFNSECQWIQSPFRFDDKFYKLLYFKKIDKIFSKLLDKNYVLTNSSIVNRRIYKHKKIKGINMGDKWHTDSRYLDGKRLDKGFGYLVIIMLEDFNEDNGCTQYIPTSHFYRERPKRNKNYKYKLLTGKKGTIVVMDTGIWHKGGKPNDTSRWSIFSYYSPWFVKPYYQYDKMIGQKKMKSLNKKLKKLLHFNSTPPINDDRRIGTTT